jgi:acetyl esterase/lipase
VKAAILVYGVYDMAAGWQDEQAATEAELGRPIHAYLGGSPTDKPEVYREASALTWAHLATPEVAFCIVWGSADPVSVPAHQSEPLVTALRQAGHPVEAVCLDGAAHFWFGQRAEAPIESLPDSWNARLAPRLLEFLEQHLRS